MKINEPETALTANKLSDLMGKGKKSIKLTVLHVTDDKNSRKQHALLFEETNDRLYLNITNLRSMIAKFGDESLDWINETVELHLVKVDVDGVLKSGVRVKE